MAAGLAHNTSTPASQHTEARTSDPIDPRGCDVWRKDKEEVVVVEKESS